jgi:hypothetical protein
VNIGAPANRCLRSVNNYRNKGLIGHSKCFEKQRKPRSEFTGSRRSDCYRLGVTRAGHFKYSVRSKHATELIKTSSCPGGVQLVEQVLKFDAA